MSIYWQLQIHDHVIAERKTANLSLLMINEKSLLVGYIMVVAMGSLGESRSCESVA